MPRTRLYTALEAGASAHASREPRAPGTVASTLVARSREHDGGEPYAPVVRQAVVEAAGGETIAGGAGHNYAQVPPTHFAGGIVRPEPVASAPLCPGPAGGSGLALTQGVTVTVGPHSAGDLHPDEVGDQPGDSRESARTDSDSPSSAHEANAERFSDADIATVVWDGEAWAAAGAFEDNQDVLW